MNAELSEGKPHFPEIPGYRISGILGQGGMGIVYLAIDLRLQRRVAIKCLPLGNDQRILQRFIEEAQAVSGLQHANIAQLFEFNADYQPPYYVMELVDGGTLDERIRDKALSPRTAAEVLETLAKAIHVAHQAGILHRDLKPSNVLLQKSSDTLMGDSGTSDSAIDVSKLRITDFGLAKRIEHDSKLTKTGEILGTPSYMSPEQATGIVAKLGPATDVYSLGSVLYELLTKRPPFVSAEPVQTLMMLLTDDPVPPRMLNRSIPLDLQTICLKCLEKKPNQRYMSAQALADDLRRFLDGQPISAKPINRTERLLKWVKRRPWQAIALGSLVLAALGSGTGFWMVSSANREIELTNRKLEQANQSLSTALKEAELSFQLSQDVLNRIVNQIRDELYDIPKAGALTLQAVRNSVDLQQRLLTIRPNSRETAQQLVSALNICRLTEWNQGETQASQGTAATLRTFLSECSSKYPGDLFFHSEFLRLSLDELTSKPIDQQQAELENLQVEFVRLLKDNPRDPSVLQMAGVFEGQWINLAAVKGDLTDALQHSEKRIDFGRQYMKQVEESKRALAQSWLLQSLIAHSEFMLAAKDIPGANNPIREATELVEQLGKDAAVESPSLQSQTARVAEIRGLAAQRESRLEDALVDYNAAIKTLRKLVDDYPSEKSYRTSLTQVQLRSISCLAQLDRKDEAQDMLESVETDIDEGLKRTPDNFLLLHFQKQFAQLKEMLAPNSPPSP